VSGIVVIGATNRPDILDPALLRPGRFDRHITVDKPDAAGRFDILRLYAAGKPVEPDVDIELLARRTPGFSGAELANVWNEAALLTVRAGRAMIGRDELDEAVERVIAGPKRSSANLSADDRRLLAIHEAGHAVAAARLGLGARVERVSIARRGIGLGHTAVLREDRLLLRQSELSDRLTIAVAGMAAEQLQFGEPSTGAEGDIEAATDLARAMAGRYGMSEGVGPVRISAKDAEVFLGRDLAATANVAPDTLSKLDDEIRTIIDRCLASARSLLAEQSDALTALADRLVDVETLEGVDLRAFLDPIGSTGRAPRPTRRRALSSSAR
jgi:cell division protease FtsH